MDSKSIRSARHLGEVILRATPLVLVIAVFASAGCVTMDTVPVVCDGGFGRSADLCLGFRNASSTPTVDGVIAGDAAWDPGFLYVLGDGNGTTVPHAIVQGRRTSDALYLAFQVNNDDTFDTEDAIVLAFDPDGTAANQRRIHIYPVLPAGALGSGQPNDIQYWKDSSQGSPNWTDPSHPPVNPTPTWLTSNIRVTSANSGSSKHWYVEVKIPIVAGPNDPGINLPATDDFGFYFSVLVAHTSSSVTNYVAEESWPLGVTVGPFIEDTPIASNWGNGIFGLVANGVTISTSDIGTDQVPDHHIDVDLPNVFHANAHNNMVNSSGTPIVANNVRATFRLKNFGIPGVSPWDLIPTGNNPTPLHNVPAGGSYSFQTSAWTVPTSLRSHYLANPNQCLEVELDTTGSDTLIVNRKAFRNTKFVDTSSPFEEHAVVGTDGYDLPAGQDSIEFLLTEHRYNTEARAPWASDITGVERIADRHYRLKARPGRDAPLKTKVTPPHVRIPMEEVNVPAGRLMADQKVRVRPGNIITLVAEGAIDRGGMEIKPNGADIRRLNDSEGRESEKGYPLAPSDSPSSRVGALVGSFDGFQQSAFVVGRATTVVVPAGADTLNLGINDTAEGLRKQRGDGYRVEVIQTPMDGIYAFTSSQLATKPPRRARRVALGQNLPTWILCGRRPTGTTITIRGTKFERFENSGCFGYMVKSIGGP